MLKLIFTRNIFSQKIREEDTPTNQPIKKKGNENGFCFHSNCVGVAYYFLPTSGPGFVKHAVDISGKKTEKGKMHLKHMNKREISRVCFDMKTIMMNSFCLEPAFVSYKAICGTLSALTMQICPFCNKFCPDHSYSLTLSVFWSACTVTLARHVYMDCHGTDHNWQSNMKTFAEDRELPRKSYRLITTLRYWKAKKESSLCNSKRLFEMLQKIDRSEAGRCKSVLVS